jgi:trigger factor
LRAPEKRKFCIRWNNLAARFMQPSVSWRETAGRKSSGGGRNPLLYGAAPERGPQAGVAELVDALDLGSSDESRGGSSPSARTSVRGDTAEVARPKRNEREKGIFCVIQLRFGKSYQKAGIDMQITETISEGLHREFKVFIPRDDLDARLTGRIEEMKPRVHLKGFRPGKAPTSFLKKSFGKSMMGEIVDEAVNESSKRALEDNGLKPAAPPRVEIGSDFEQVAQGKSDLEFTLAIDLMPDFEPIEVTGLQVQKLVADVTDKEVDDAVYRIAEQSRTYSPGTEGEAAEKDDSVVIDFVGRVDGEEFAGGKAEDFNLVLGSGQLIPGFEDQLIGAKAGDGRDVNVTFPAEYPEPKLAGKDAVFAVTVKEVKKPDTISVDDELAKKVGLDSLGILRERVRDQLKRDFAQASRMHLKRRILDALDTAHSFPLPPAMVEQEFDGIWRAVQAELEREGKTAEEEGKSEEELKKEYHDIAERRVRLGLVLAKIGEQNGIQVPPDEVNRAAAARARQFAMQSQSMGQAMTEQEAYQTLVQNPQAMAEIRAPLFEDKVVDFIAELAQVDERKVDREILFLDPDSAEEKLSSIGLK